MDRWLPRAPGIWASEEDGTAATGGGAARARFRTFLRFIVLGLKLSEDMVDLWGV